jgi:hypothetical protein
MMAVIDQGNPDIRQGREEIVQQSVPTAIWIKQNLLRAAQPTFNLRHDLGIIFRTQVSPASALWSNASAWHGDWTGYLGHANALRNSR